MYLSHLHLSFWPASICPVTALDVPPLVVVFVVVIIVPVLDRTDSCPFYRLPLLLLLSHLIDTVCV